MITRIRKKFLLSCFRILFDTSGIGHRDIISCLLLWLFHVRFKWCVCPFSCIALSLNGVLRGAELWVEVVHEVLLGRTVSIGTLLKCRMMKDPRQKQHPTYCQKIKTLPWSFMFDYTDIGTDPVTMKRCKICRSAYSRIEISSVSCIFKRHKHVKAHIPLLSVKYRSLCKCYPKFVSRKTSVSASRMSIPMFTTVLTQSRGLLKALLEFYWMFRNGFIKDLFSRGSEIPKFGRFHWILIEI